MKVAVFGAGTMGRGIAQVFAAKGHSVLMYASSPASAQRHKDALSKSLQKRVDKGKMAQEAKDALMGLILIPEEHSEAADADLVIECIKEDMEVKKTLFKELSWAFDEFNPEFITVYYGEDVKEDEANESAQTIVGCFPDADVSVVSGGQPVYYYMIAVE